MPGNNGQGQKSGRWYKLCFVPSSADSSDDSDTESVVIVPTTPIQTSTSEEPSPESPPHPPPPREPQINWLDHHLPHRYFLYHHHNQAGNIKLIGVIHHYSHCRPGRQHLKLNHSNSLAYINLLIQDMLHLWIMILHSNFLLHHILHSNFFLHHQAKNIKLTGTTHHHHYNHYRPGQQQLKLIKVSAFFRFQPFAG